MLTRRWRLERPAGLSWSRGALCLVKPAESTLICNSETVSWAEGGEGYRERRERQGKRERERDRDRERER